jgi:hypothetical protein
LADERNIFPALFGDDDVIFSKQAGISKSVLVNISIHLGEDEELNPSNFSKISREVLKLRL